MNFQVRLDGQPRIVEIIFGGERDVARLWRWCAPESLADNPHIRDAVEFSRLAAKRWRYFITGQTKAHLRRESEAMHCSP